MSVAFRSYLVILSTSWGKGSRDQIATRSGPARKQDSKTQALPGPRGPVQASLISNLRRFHALSELNNCLLFQYLLDPKLTDGMFHFTKTIFQTIYNKSQQRVIEEAVSMVCDGKKDEPKVYMIQGPPGTDGLKARRVGRDEALCMEEDLNRVTLEYLTEQQLEKEINLCQSNQNLDNDILRVSEEKQQIQDEIKVEERYLNQRLQQHESVRVK
ncbi:unnamed protein product [Didymodactylos carnosus]|uniref:Uncharacterized protein n=1 Tax=Didymodactylos carnosus TaxID=1234261 RepID=A0A8S2SI90_9BILA|nr:unnamed protein product [Didymodactylos carnosus]CAF4222458.1 unnamed protein product [Didymodactylos carnosus]